MPCQYQSVVDNLADKKDITMLTQDRDGGVVIMDSTKYTQKCSNLVNMEQFCCSKKYLARWTKDNSKMISIKRVFRSKFSFINAQSAHSGLKALNRIPVISLCWFDLR